MNEIACANCGEPVIIGCECHHCGYRDETDWLTYTTGDDDADAGKTTTTEDWAEWQDDGGEGG